MQYVVPGAICYYLYRFTTGNKKESKYIPIISCIISYLLLSLVSLARAKNMFHIALLPDTPFINSAVSSILGILLTVAIVFIISRKCFKKITTWLFHKTPYETIWMDVLDFSKGSNLKVYLKNEPFYVTGHHLVHEDNGNDSWFAVSAFTKIDKKTNEIYNNERSYNDNSEIKYVFKLSDVEHIEIF